MNKKVFIFGGIGLAVVIIIVIVAIVMNGSQDYQINLNVTALEIKGHDESHTIEVPCQIVGVYTKNNSKDNTFKGTIKIGDYEIYGETQSVTFHEGSYGSGGIYKDKKNLLGTLYFNEDFTEFVICIHDSQTWSVDKGVAIVYPGADRAAALETMERMGQTVSVLRGMK